MKFDETFYLQTYPDVAKAVREGKVASGRVHYETFGHSEGRFGAPEAVPHGKAPVAFFFFNRPDLAAATFARIRLYQPDTLLLVADGPRQAEEAERVAACREAVERAIDWPCRVLRDYAEGNLGCRRRIASGLAWVFEQVEEAMILEDDCVPHPDFFRFCHAALDRYREERRVWHVSGSAFVRPPGCHGSAWFSRHSDIWGWATWRRAFAQYDPDIPDWGWRRRLPGQGWLGDTPLEERYWRRCLDGVWRGKVDTWDYQWHFTVMKHRGLAVVPRENLITNIGHGAAATHTQLEGGDVDLQATAPLGELLLSPEPRRDREIDTLLFMRRYALGDLQPIGHTTREALLADPV